LLKFWSPKFCKGKAESKESNGKEIMHVGTRRGEGEEGASSGERGQQQKHET
jgi:hypothetical protein